MTVQVISTTDLLRVKVHMKDQSMPVEHMSVRNTYIKGGFYCVYCHDETVYKYPIENIWRVTETTEKLAQLKANAQ